MAAETLRDWLSAYRRGGFEALQPKPRCDQGRARAIPQEMADLLCALKEETPALSVDLVIEQGEVPGRDRRRSCTSRRRRCTGCCRATG